jgi:hypothetical protein
MTLFVRYNDGTTFTACLGCQLEGEMERGKLYVFSGLGVASASDQHGKIEEVKLSWKVTSGEQHVVGSVEEGISYFFK